MAELLKCAVCQGIVSSDASRCPHCGSPNFKSSSYIQKQEQLYRNNLERERRAHQEQRERMFGSVLLRWHDIKKSPESPYLTPRYRLLIDGRSLLIDGRYIGDMVECHGPIDDEKKYIRLHPGTHTLTMESEGHVSSKSFSCDADSTSITIARKSTGFFTTYWKLVFVMVE